MGKSSDRDGGVGRGKKGSSVGMISSGGCDRSTTATEGRRRAVRLASRLRLRLQSKRGAATRVRVVATASSNYKEVAAEAAAVEEKGEMAATGKGMQQRQYCCARQRCGKGK
ncbi:hypothetical protein GW17_00032810 [Ensete ventricosum]|nr:hypothetical protein GW17_00032810 [Ensete ventricosum]